MDISSNGNGKPLDRQTILACDDIERVEVEVPDWGGKVWVRTMEGTQRDLFEGHQITHPWEDVRARMAVYSVCNERGELVFSEADIPALTRKSARALDLIFEVGAKLSGLGKKDVEELKKNLLATRS